MATVPRDWPDGHKWVSFEDPEHLQDANCPACLEGPKPPKISVLERRFLIQIEKLPTDLPPGKLISQGYLSIDPVVRIRISGDKAWITVKGPGLIQSEEFEYEIKWQDAEQMLQLCRHAVIKTGRRLEHGAHTWDIDEFHGPLEGLWIAKVNLKTRYDGYETPDWIGREVSSDRRFTNASLARANKIPSV